MNGRISTEVKAHDGPAEDLVRKRLALLDGVERYALSLWRLPHGRSLDRVDLDVWPREYIQAAGSQTAMTVELREAVDGKPAHYVLGLEGTALMHDESVDVEIPWNGAVSIVRKHEVLSGAEGAEAFAEYLRSGQVGDRYTRREIFMA